MPLGRLIPKHEKAVQKNFQFLMTELDASKIVDFLYEREVISFDNHEQIVNEKTRELRNRTFLRILLHAGPGNSFDVFIESLSKDFKHVEEKLLETVRSLEPDYIPKKDFKLENDELKIKLEELQKKLTENEELLMNTTKEILRLNNNLKHENEELKKQLEELHQKHREVKELLKYSSEEKRKQNKNLNFLMVGKTGHGKSALGNTILGHQAFRSMECTSSITQHIEFFEKEVDGRKVKIADTPGVLNTRLDTENATKTYIQETTSAISSNPQGFDAFLLVLRHGRKFTEEDKKVIIFFKKIFGKTFIKDFCILVVTCGDDYRFEKESFGDWLDRQPKELLEECRWRVVLFDNKTNDPEIKKNQLDCLFEMVDMLTFHGHRYKYTDFNKAQDGRERLLIESKKEMI